MTITEQYIEQLRELKEGELGKLRCLANQPLDERLEGFDLFTGLWWPLRQKSPKAPKREIAWLIAKLYAQRPLKQEKGVFFAGIAGVLHRKQKKPEDRERFITKFDSLLRCSTETIEPEIAKMLNRIYKDNPCATIDWAALADDLWKWQQHSVREKWARQFLNVSSN